MTAILDTPPTPAMTAEQESAFLEWLRAVEAKALRVAAERDVERRLRIAYEARIGELEHQNRELRKANETWQGRLAAMAPTVELPRYVPESAPVRRRGRRGRHQ